MNKRRVVYFTIIAALILGYVYYYSSHKAEVISVPSISREIILQDFKDLEDNEIPKGQLGGTFYPTIINFPTDFSGHKGQEFYVTMEDGHIILTQKYLIELIDNEGQQQELMYKVKDNWENFIPPEGKFESYSFDYSKQKWVKNQNAE